MSNATSERSEREVRNLEDELTCIFVEVITVDPPVPAIDAKTIVLQNSRPEAGRGPFCLPRPRQRALLQYFEAGSTGTGRDDSRARQAMTVPDARHRSRDALVAELRGAPLFLTGFLAAFCAAGILLLTPVWSAHVRDLANHARHSVGQYGASR
jgi:hypothetical protein